MATKKRKASPRTVGRTDGLVNLMTGLGTTRDKRMATEVRKTPRDIVSELDTLMEDNDLVANIVTIPAREMTREWIDLKGENGAAVEGVLTRANAQRVFFEALMWQRLFGSAIIVMGLTDQATNEAGKVDLSLPRRRGKLVWLTAYDRYECAGVLKNDLGEITHYLLQSKKLSETISVHASRVLRIDGDPMPRRNRDEAGWGMSIIRRCKDAIRDLDVATAGVGAALVEFDQAVLKIERLTEILAADKERVVQNRIELLDTMRSIFRMMTIDANDDFVMVSRNFSGIPDTLNVLVERVASAAGMSVSQLFGRAPSGLNNSSDTELRWFFSQTRSAQFSTLGEPLRTLINVVCEGEGIDEPPALDFAPLWLPSEKEKADTHLVQAQADSIYLQAGVVDEDEIAAARFSPTGYSTDTVIEPIEADDVDLDDEDEESDGESAAPTDGATDVQKTALNGAQVTSLQGIVTAVAAGQIPRDSGVAMIALAFQLSPSEADAVVGSAGRGFKPPEAE